MTSDDLKPLFTFTPNTVEQDKSIEAVYTAARALAETIAKNVPQKHAQQAVLQLAGIVTLCRQGIEVEAVEHRPLLVKM